MRTISWGTIGCGDVCEHKSGPALKGVPGSRLVAVMRRTRELAEDFALRHNVPKFYDNIDDLLADEEVQAVYIATPNNTHLKPVLAAANAGKHILCEKPMARSAEACRQMIDACREHDLSLAVAYYRRCYPSIMRAKEIIDAGEIGGVREIRINDEFPLSHRLDLVHYLCGDAAAVLKRNETLPPGSHAEQGEVLHVSTLSGAEAIMNVGWEEKNAPETVDILGDAGEIHVTDLKKGQLRVIREGHEQQEQPGPLPATHWGLVQNFVAHLNDGEPLACDGVEGRKSTVILDIVNELTPEDPQVPVDYT
ncbi:MAG: Gfo/Idh/MocA family protein [Phycisphaerae bacterium]